ncbi:MAG: 23S rRNA (uracil(1939)-C(5))-methyltransferase RlmD [Thiohalospira sp.]
MARRKRLPREPFEATIESLSPEARGVARIDGKVTFIDGTLPGERVLFRYTDRKRSHDSGRVEEVLEAAPERVEPDCPHFGVCGGCSLQHMDHAAQVAHKAATVTEQLQRIGGVAPEAELPPLTGPLRGYRRRARLGVRWVPAKERVLVGFRERGTGYIVDTERCPVLHPAIGERLPELAATLQSLTIYDQIPQIEVAIGDEGGALVVRHLAPLGPGDAQRLADFGETSGLRIQLQPGGPESVESLEPDSPVDLAYDHPGSDVRLSFRATDFVQVNGTLNRAMVERALDWLALEPGQRVLDLFCGIGNFGLPIARAGAEVVGVEGEAGLVERARRNAEVNGLTEQTTFHVADLSEPGDSPAWGGRYDSVVLDPARTGAREVLDIVAASGARRVVYVSCNPATLARDAGELVARWYRLARAGVLNMFPHTDHTEAMAIFERA